MMKDEGPWLLEWVAFHRLIGFDRIVVLSNDCTDGTDALLDRLAALGRVRHLRNPVPEGARPQPAHLRCAGALPEVTGADWVMVLDADEFLAIRAGGGRLPDLIAALPPGAQAVALTWRLFGSAGHEGWRPGPATLAFTRAAPDDFPRGWGVKTLFRPFPGMRLGIHRPQAAARGRSAAALAAQHWVNGSGARLPPDFVASGWRSTPATIGYALGQVNHYAVKGIETFLLKADRGNVNFKTGKYGPAYFAIHDRNEIEDLTLARHAPALTEELARLRADPEIARLEAAAVAAHEARLASLRARPDWADRVAALRAAALVPIEGLDRVLYIHHLSPAFRARIEALRAAGVPDEVLARQVAAATSAAEAARGDRAGRLRPRRRDLRPAPGGGPGH
jgi:hypothetical protein